MRYVEFLIVCLIMIIGGSSILAVVANGGNMASKANHQIQYEVIISLGFCAILRVIASVFLILKSKYYENFNFSYSEQKHFSKY